MTQLASSFALSLLNSGTVYAANNIDASTHQGQLAPSGTYSSGNITTYKEGDTIKFRFVLTADQASTGRMKVQYTVDDQFCKFFDGTFQLSTIEQLSGASATVTKFGAPVDAGADYEQNLDVNFSGAGSVRVNYILKLSNEAGKCNGSSQHTQLAKVSGDFKNIGQMTVPIPAKDVIELPEIKVTKNVDTDGDGKSDRTASAGEWSFSLDGGNPVATDANGQVTFYDVTPDGNHTVTETSGPTAQTFLSGSGTNCTFNGSTATANVKAGTTAQEATCTFLNTVKKGSITIVKDAIPNNAQDFTFTASGSGVSGFTLDDDSGATGADNTYSNTKSFSNLVAGNYTFTENATAGWTFDNLSCPSATIQKSGASVTITLSAGQNITCTFTNRKNGTITVNKVTNPANDPTLFSITASGSGGSVLNTATQNVSTSQSVVYDVTQGGTYNVDETVPAGWTMTTNTCTNIVISSTNLNPTCTITNTKKAKLIIIKDAIPNDSQDFSFSTTGGLSPSSFSLDDDSNQTLSNTQTFDNVTPGNYTVTENSTSGWALTGLVCGEKVVQGATASVTLAPGQTLTCKYTNTKYSTVSGYKYLVNSDGSVSGTLKDWAINLILSDGSTVSSTAKTNSNGYYEFTGLLPGVYYLQEQNQSGYTQVTGTEICPSSKLSVNLSAGQNSTNRDFCNFKNGSISGYKFNDLNGNGNKDANEPLLAGWTIVLKKLNTDKNYTQIATTTTGANGSYTFGDLAPGTYSVCEVQQSGWVQTYPKNNACHDGIVVDKTGESNSNQNFGNQQKGMIKIIKKIDSSSKTKDTFDLTLDRSVVYEGATDGSSTGYISVTPGNHYVGEEAGNKWVNLSDYDVTYSEDCQKGKVNVSGGEKVTCIITNHKKAKITVIKDAIPNDQQDFKFTVKPVYNHEDDNYNHEDRSVNNLLNPENMGDSENNWNHDNKFILDDDKGAQGADNKYQNNKEVKGLKEGWYQLSEQSVEGWDLDGIQCYSSRDDHDWGHDYGDEESNNNEKSFNQQSSDDHNYQNDDEDGHHDYKGKKIYLKYGDNIVCKFINVKRATVTVIKDAKTDSSQSFKFSQNIDKSGDFSLVDDGTNALNKKVFNNLKVGKNGKTFGISEQATSGWRLADFSCDYNNHNDDENDNEWNWSNENSNNNRFMPQSFNNNYNHHDDQYDEGDDYNHEEDSFDHHFKVNPGQNVVCTFTNEQTVLFLSKSNNKPNPTVVGDQVLYTLKVSIPEGSANLNDVLVTDLAPENFKYVGGSWTANSSVRGNLKLLGTTTEPTYHSPGQWKLGNMIGGEVVTLTYLANILDVVSPGTYPDVAFANGMTDEEVTVYDNLSVSSTPFVQTKVTVNKDVTPVVVNELANTGDAISLLNLIVPAIMILLTILGFQATRWQSAKGGK